MALPVTITDILAGSGPASVGPYQGNRSSLFTTAGVVDIFGIGASGQEKVSQTFLTSGALSVAIVTALLDKQGSPTDNVICDIYAVDGSSHPTGTSLGTATNVISASSLPTSAIGPSRYSFTFSPAVSLSASTTYAVVFSRSGSLDATNIAIVCGTNTDTYANGICSLLSGSTWTDQARDLSISLSDGTAAYYAFGHDATTDTTVNAVKSTAPDTSWSSIATKTGYVNYIWNLTSFQVGDLIHIALLDGNTTNAVNLKYLVFDIATDTFVIAETIFSAMNPLTSASATENNTSIVVRSTGEVVIFYNGPRVANMGNSYAQTYYTRRTAINTWAAGTQVSAGGQVDFTLLDSVLGTSSRITFAHQPGGGGTGPVLRSLNSSNSLGTADTTGSSVVATTLISYNNAGTQKDISVSIGAASNGNINVKRWTDADSPSVTSTIPVSSTAGIPTGLFVDGTTVYMVYQLTADSDLYVRSSTDDGATWSSATNIFTGTVSATLFTFSLDGKIYQRGSNVVIPYVVNDNGTLKYNEYTVRSVATGSVGASSGTGAASVIGASTAASSGAATGTGAATGKGNANFPGVGSATGAGAASGAGIAANTAIGAATGTGAAGAVGASTAASAGSASGTSTAGAVGASTAASVASATGSGAASAVGAANIAGVASATGTGAATGVSTANASTGAASGTGAAAAAGNANFAGIGATSGTGAASAVGAANFAGIGNAPGTGAAAGVSPSGSTASGAGSASGTGAASAVGTGVISAVGNAIGIANISAVHFDGSTYLYNSSLSSTDNTFFSFSMWIRADPPAPSEWFVFQGDLASLDVIELDFTGNNYINFFAKLTLGPQLSVQPSFVVVDSKWHHYVGTLDAGSVGGARTGQMLIDGVDRGGLFAFGSGAINFPLNGKEFTVGASGGAAHNFPLVGDVAEAWIAPGVNLLDGSGNINSTTLTKFRETNGKPVYLGASGELPTGTAPAIYMTGDASRFGTNRGSGGSFSITGTLTNAIGPGTQAVGNALFSAVGNATGFTNIPAASFSGDQLEGTLTTTDTPFLSVSYWIKIASPSTNILRHDTGHQIIATGGDGSAVVNINPTSQLLTRTTVRIDDNRWHHVLSSHDITNAAGSRAFRIYVDGVDRSLLAFEAGPGGTVDCNGHTYDMPSNSVTQFEIADFWFSNETLLSSGDISPTTIAKFRDAGGKPVYLGANGELPTGTAPLIFFTGNAASFSTNRGSGGSFSLITGSLSDTLGPGTFGIGNTLTIATAAATGTGTASAVGHTVPTVWNAADKSANIALSNGNLTATHSGTATSSSVRTSNRYPSGKWYGELHADFVSASPGTFAVGIANASFSLSDYVGLNAFSLGYFGNNDVQRNGSIDHLATYASGDTISFALDLDNKKIWFRKNNNSWDENATHDPATNTGGYDISSITGDIYVAFSSGNTSHALTANFGASAFAFTAPTGFIGFDVSSGIAIGAASGTGVATAIGNANVTATASATGTGTAAATGNANFAGIANAAGTGTATFVSVSGTVGAASGAGAAAATGNANFAGKGSATGTGTAAAIGQNPGVGAATGNGAATAVGRSTAASVGAATGAGAAAGIGSATFAAVGNAAGTGTANAANSQANIGQAVGTGAAAAVGQSTAAATGSAAGTGAAAAVGKGVFNAVAAATGTGAASATGNANFTGVGNATGTGTAAAVGNANFAGTASAAGTSTAAATGKGMAAGVGNAAGAGAANGFTSQVNLAQASGFGAAAAVGRSTAAAVGAATGAGAAAGQGAGQTQAKGAATGSGTATAVGIGAGVSTGNAAGTGTAAATAKIIFASFGNAPGLGTALGIGSQIGFSTRRHPTTGVGAAGRDGFGDARPASKFEKRPGSQAAKRPLAA